MNMGYPVIVFGVRIKIKKPFMASVFSVLKSGEEQGANETHKTSLAPVPRGLLRT